jgi:hypothetical protein
MHQQKLMWDPRIYDFPEHKQHSVGIRKIEDAGHRIDRVPGFLSSRLNWYPPPPHPLASVPVPPPFFARGGHTHLRHLRERRRGSQFGRRDRHSGILGIVYCNPFTMQGFRCSKVHRYEAARCTVCPRMPFRDM